MGRALVLGGGGVTGVAWGIGLLAGLAAEGVDLTAPDLVVGTSAGSVVGAQLLGGTPVEELYERQLAPPREGELAATTGAGFVLRWMWELGRPGSEQVGRARIGAAALAADTMPEQVRRDVIASRLPSHDWPATPLRITASDALTGEFTVFDASSGVSLVDAVAASCSVPLVWPPTTVDGRRYVNGGVRSSTNADLATGCDVVLVIGPSFLAMKRSQSLGRQLARLGPGVRSLAVGTDRAARSAMGRQALDPAARPPAARAGRAQAATEAARIRALWG